MTNANAPVLGARLGSGGFGVVYRGTCPIHGEVAIKVISQPPGSSKDEWEDVKQGLIHEAKMMSQGTHRNVVPVHYVHQPERTDEIWLVMKLCQGSVETDYNRGPLPLSTVRRVMTDVASGLVAIHARKMIHRDIKPANILVDGPVFRVSDFGLVTDKLLFGYASARGYLDHVAYEIWGGEGTSVRTDVWAFGMTTYRLLHGRTWYSSWCGPDRPAALIPQGGFAQRLVWLPHIPAKWRRFIRQAMNDDRTRRHQTATAMLNGLARLPIEPAWTCVVSTGTVTWELPKGRRLWHVQWTAQSPRKHHWIAENRPTFPGGVTRTLGSSGGQVAAAAAHKGLQDFFASHE